MLPACGDDAVQIWPSMSIVEDDDRRRLLGRRLMSVADHGAAGSLKNSCGAPGR